MKGLMCQFSTTLYPLGKVNWCLYGLFISDKGQIEKYYMSKVKPKSIIWLTVYQNQWTISCSITMEKVQIYCLIEACYAQIKFPFHVINMMIPLKHRACIFLFQLLLNYTFILHSLI